MKKVGNSSYLDEWCCKNLECKNTYAYHVRTLPISRRIVRLMFFCNNRDVVVDFEEKITLVLKEKNSDDVLFTMPGVFQPTVKHDYPWLESKISLYELMV